jgi:hypothetical protein
MDKIDNREILSKVLEIAFKKNWSRQKLSEEVGFSRRALADYEANVRPLSRRMKFKIDRFLEKYPI